MEDKKVKASIIIPHYNQKECLIRLFPNIVDQTYKDFEVIVVDDCSPDKETVTFIEEFIKDKPYMSLVKNTSNLRFVGACNKGISLAKGEYICLLNQDTELKNNFVQRNIEILDSDPTIGGLICTVIDQNGNIWFSGGRYLKGIPYNLRDDFQQLRQVDFIAGTAAFYRREVFDRIGLLDETYIMYHEDVEFGQRIKEKTKYQICAFSDKLVTHLIQTSIPREGVWYYSSRNILMLSKKYDPESLPYALAHIMVHYVGIHLVRAFRYAIAGLRGTIDGLAGKSTRAY